MAVPLPPPGTIAVYSDIGCPWARLQMHRLHRARRRAGLEAALRIEHRTFPLELVNSRPTPRRIVEAEAAVIAGLDEEVEWRAWDAPLDTYPVTTLLAMEAVQAAAEQDGRCAEMLDLALRDAFFRRSRCISILPAVLDVAATVQGLDVPALERSLAEGSARRRVRRAPEEVQGSPHLFLSDGTAMLNPGLVVRLLDNHVPVVESDDPGAVDDLVSRASRAA